MNILLLFIGLSILLLVNWHWFSGAQKYEALTMDSSIHDINYQSAVDSHYPAPYAEPDAETQPLENGVNLYQMSLPYDQPIGQYDNALYAAPTTEVFEESTKLKSNMTENGDMILRRAFDNRSFSYPMGADPVATHANVW